MLVDDVIAVFPDVGEKFLEVRKETRIGDIEKLCLSGFRDIQAQNEIYPSELRRVELAMLSFESILFPLSYQNFFHGEGSFGAK
ncbi:MAG TPA: hypothetical protein VHZ04_02475 [Candidatus Paceibacterota bacterium]|nr:hypothetical protein [Candidatus Paceibacterota bacterium]